MVNEQLLNPQSIVVVGGSENCHKPGGNVLKNLIEGHYKGDLYVVNPKGDNIQGQRTFNNINDLPNVDLAIIAVAASHCESAIRILAETKHTKAFIMISAGFSELGDEGKKVEDSILNIINNADAALIGPNCVGLINQNYNGVFTSPIPALDPDGCDFISSSGGTAVYICEAGIPMGLRFSSIYTVGNSAQMGVEDILEHFDKTFDPKSSSKIKLLYIESIKSPEKLLKHASSLIRKGCKIAAIKAGGSEAGKRAASSHTGALATDDLVVHALLRKAGIVRCFSREELVYVGCIFMHKKAKGKNIAIITHAGGPGVMLSDALSKGRLNVPPIEGEIAQELLAKLDKGSSVGNPIDFISTGTAEQLGEIIATCEHKLNNIDAMCVIFGNPGLNEVSDVFKVIEQKTTECSKPIFPILPSIINAKEAIDEFIAQGCCNFPDEVCFGSALANVYNTFKPQSETPQHAEIDIEKIRDIIDHVPNGYLSPKGTASLLDAAGIPRVRETVVKTLEEGITAAYTIGYPVAIKVVGPLHKTDVQGVVLNISNDRKFTKEFERMMQIPETTNLLIQPMLDGIELFVGAKNEAEYGHMIVCGIGGIFIEVMRDIVAALTPLSSQDAIAMISHLRSQKILDGIRGQEPINKVLYADIISRVSALCLVAPEIFEMDLNPLLAKGDKIVAVDARIRIEK
ncbi:MAG: acetate--CoA ligase family protein [Bacteroidales bacterium]|jgi:acyl-CoA synthetase (NDP forming)|nr:acetate--CoA ligase family protein [Bacteroidales bacterium]